MMQVDATLPALKSEFNRQAHAYWESRRHGAPMPRQIDMIEIAPMLNGVILIDVLTDPLDFYYRFVGTRIDDFLSRPLTGRTVREFDHQRPPSRIWSAFCRVAETGEPAAGEVPYVGPQRDVMTMEDVIMPVAADGSHVSSLFVAVDFLRRPERNV